MQIIENRKSLSVFPVSNVGSLLVWYQPSHKKDYSRLGLLHKSCYITPQQAGDPREQKQGFQALWDPWDHSLVLDKSNFGWKNCVN